MTSSDDIIILAREVERVNGGVDSSIYRMALIVRAMLRAMTPEQRDALYDQLEHPRDDFGNPRAAAPTP